MCVVINNIKTLNSLSSLAPHVIIILSLSLNIFDEIIKRNKTA